MTRFLSDAQTPEHWVERLRGNGIRISARRLREKARTCGQFYCLGRTVFLSPGHVETILGAAAMETHESNRHGG
jgi:hypothetical protein